MNPFFNEWRIIHYGTTYAGCMFATMGLTMSLKMKDGVEVRLSSRIIKLPRIQCRSFQSLSI
jgi:hypothetical protein